ncbi:MAG: hypothetical protein ACM3JD_19010, partial [Rudaea sp.]
TLVRALAIYSGEAAFGEVLYLAALAALGITALLSLLNRQQQQKRVWAGMAISAPLWLVPFLPIPQAHASIAFWLGMGVFNLYVFMLSLKLFDVQTRRQPWRQVIRGIAIVSAAGLPLTPAFWGWIGLYAAALQGGQWLFLLLLPASLSIALIPFWRGFLDENDYSRAPGPVQYAGLALLVIVPIVEAVVPFFAVSLFGRAVEEGSFLGYNALLHAPNLLQPIALLIAAAAPAPLAFWLARKQPEWGERVERVPGSFVAGLDFSAFTRAPLRLLDLGSLVLRQATTLVEQHPLGWILFAALWVALWLFNMR